MAELGDDEELDSPPASWQFEHIEIVPWQGLVVAVGHLPEFLTQGLFGASGRNYYLGQCDVGAWLSSFQLGDLHVTTHLKY